MFNYSSVALLPKSYSKYLLKDDINSKIFHEKSITFIYLAKLLKHKSILGNLITDSTKRIIERKFKKNPTLRESINKIKSNLVLFLNGVNFIKDF